MQDLVHQAIPVLVSETRIHLVVVDSSEAVLLASAEALEVRRINDAAMDRPTRLVLAYCTRSTPSHLQSSCSVPGTSLHVLPTLYLIHSLSRIIALEITALLSRTIQQIPRAISNVLPSVLPWTDRETKC